MNDQNPNRVVLYPEQNVDPKTNTIQVTPELVTRLFEDYFYGNREFDHKEGDLRLRVDYDDLKALLQAAGKEIHEVRQGVDL